MKRKQGKYHLVVFDLSQEVTCLLCLCPSYHQAVDSSSGQRRDIWSSQHLMMAALLPVRWDALR